jgi:hypothetical protein
MSGEIDLAMLLQSMQPVLQPGEFIFCSVAVEYDYSQLQPIGLFHELEGLTLILPRSQADAAGLSYTASFRMITLSVHSSLEAVGFLAAITTKLAAHGISVNPISAYYHDHLFVPTSRAEQVMQLLHEFSISSASGNSILGK